MRRAAAARRASNATARTWTRTVDPITYLFNQCTPYSFLTCGYLWHNTRPAAGGTYTLQ